MMRKLILHIPHSSIKIPLKEGYIVDDTIINNEILTLTDWYTDDLFYSESDVMVIADFSRLFCDVERFADDRQEVMAQFGMGVLYEKTDLGAKLRNITPELRAFILENYYWKHHSHLNLAVEKQLEDCQMARIIDCHSFPDIPFQQSLNKDDNRPDFSIGTDSFHTPKKLVDASVAFFESKGFSVGVDWPYSGSLVPLDYYQKDKRVESIMLEINRKLYLKGTTNEKSENYEYIREVTSAYLNAMRTI